MDELHNPLLSAGEKIVLLAEYIRTLAGTIATDLDSVETYNYVYDCSYYLHTAITIDEIATYCRTLLNPSQWDTLTDLENGNYMEGMDVVTTAMTENEMAEHCKRIAYLIPTCAIICTQIYDWIDLVGDDAKL